MPQKCEIPINILIDNDIKDILNDIQNIAIIGLSPKQEKASFQVAKYLQEKGFNIFPIYPKEDTILGEKVYRSIHDIKENIDIVVMFRKAVVAKEVLNDILERGNIKYFWLQLGIINNEVVKKANSLGIKTVQNKCIKIEHQKLL